ncbi:hypothetical protein [Marinobacter lutaoensis]|nr:hypothetical protein [Marinobacter lutaoensis]
MCISICPSSRLVRALKAGLLVSAMSAVVLPVSAAEEPELSSPAPEVAIRAVQATLPSVAILGQKEGPAGTTEVFIQVPGVLNMQSVYVLSDGKTVISGVIVPPIKHGFPGSQLTLPTGQPSVDPRAPRDSVERLNEVLGVAGPDVGARAGTNDDFSVPALPRSGAKDGNISAGGDLVPAPEVGAASQAQTSGRADSAPEVPGSAVASPGPVSEKKASGTSAPSGDEEDLVIESLDDVAETGSFSRAVRTMLKNDSDIAALRNLAGQKEQADEYLKLVKTLPSIKQGNAPKAIYVMFDPNCEFCHRYYQDLQPSIRSGVLEVHWIPAIVKSDNRSSLTASAALLAETQRDNGKPLEMLHAVMTDKEYTSRIDNAPNVDRLVPFLEPVVKNTAIMAMVRATTPLVIFENVDGELAINAGIPDPGYESLIRSEAS